MKLLRKTLKTISTLVLMLLFANTTFAQYGDDYGDDNYDYGDEYNEADTGEQDDYYSDYEYVPTDDNKTVEKEKPKPYVRFTMPIDTITELVTYTEIVEVPTPKVDSKVANFDAQDLVSADSFHYRAVKWMLAHYGPDSSKYITTNYYDYDHEQWRLEIKNTFNLYIKNQYTKTEAGKVHFNLVLRLRDNRYKIQIDHLVHEKPKTVNQKTTQKNYFEYYLKTETSVRDNDKFLIAADRIIKQMIEDLKKAIAPPAELTVDREEF